MTYPPSNRLTLEQLERLEHLGWVVIQISELWGDLFDQAQLHIKENKFQPAQVAKNPQLNAIRNDVTFWIDDKTKNGTEKIFLNLIESIKNELQDFFRISLNNFETHYALFIKDHFYKRHTDQKKVDNKRAFSFVYYLNQNWKTENGGQLVGYKNDTELEIFKVEPEAGTFILFKSEIEHQVLPSLAPRFSVTGWIRTL